MKKLCIILTGALIVFAACSGPETKAVPVDSTKNHIDTVKIDTVKPNDSIIKG